MAQVGVSLRSLDLSVPKKALHLVQAATRIDQEAGIAVAKVMNADILQTCFAP